MLSFRLGSIPVRIHFFFFLTALMLAGGRPGPLLISWIIVVLVSVMVHELGHALMGRLFGLTPEIELHGFGGTTSWSSGRPLGPVPHILISLAGPGAGMLLGGVVWLAAARLSTTPMRDAVVSQLIWVNVGWGVLNLMPVLPLDGGNVMRRTLDLVTGGRGAKPAHVISALLSLALIGYVLTHGGLKALLQGNVGALWPAILATLFLVQNVRALLPPPEAPPSSG